ncbi:hypothetical protein F5144DRAFT_392328 [Chaetomium tenue]|uniref:Uncharacterized protein n=1 Tax=Chaetomium tenue TaxID=1854479 RepID=A0ACB7P0U4_9PEZI|nr:hypothetical protein F5144DRAFT_392328 [Chaetomium globosum]
MPEPRPSSEEGHVNETVIAIRAAAAEERRRREATEAKHEPTAEEVAVMQAVREDVLCLEALAKPPNRDLPPNVRDPEAHRRSRWGLDWMTCRFVSPSNHLPRTWGYTILRTTYTPDSDAAVTTAVHALTHFMRAMARRECRGVTDRLQRLQRSRQLPAGVSTTGDARPSDEFYMKRFVTELVEDKAGLKHAAVPGEVCAYFRRWSLARFAKEEKYFSAASPRLKSAILFDEETVEHLQGLAAGELDGDPEVSVAGKEFWVKAVEAEPEKRNMRPGLSDCFRVPVGLLDEYWFERDRAHPAYEMLWKEDERFPGELLFTT